jgi:hypothetical protein
MLAIIAIAHGWLYFGHGVAGSIDTVLSTSGMLLVALPVIIVSAAFHELGHAAGLRYGGGKARGIGFGFYLLYPSFYTDVTEAYRLGRWARLRTDLGGVYFHLIFALAMIALYWISGQEFLLLVVLLINLDILYQCLPHMRLDGYWALADFTGIPDPFSQAGLLLESWRRNSGSTGSIVSNLKPWVRAVITAYLVLTVPVLALLLFFIIAFVPSRLVTVWDSALKQTRTFTMALNSGDPVGMANSLAQFLILALLVLGIGYALYSLGRSSMRALWSWSKPTPARRIAGTLGTAGAVAALAWIWIPQLPYTIWAWTVPAGPPGTESFAVAERTHVQTPVSYPQVPPVGGKHAPIWQNCGFYDTPIRNENGVHSLEHGAVWITYRPDLTGEQVDALRSLARGDTYLLVSPYPDLATPVVASAWGRQLQLDSVDDPRLDEFVRAFRLGRQAPEVGERCDGGVGQPG